MGGKGRGFTTHEFSSALAGLFVIALALAVAVLYEGAWWERLLAGLATLGIYAVAGLGAVLVFVPLVYAAFALGRLRKRAELRRVLLLASAGEAGAARSLAARIGDEFDFGYQRAFEAAPDLAREYAAAAARTGGELRLPLVQLLLRHAPWSLEVDAALSQCVGTFDAKLLRRWLSWLELNLPREPGREQRLAAATERAFGLMDETQRRYAWRDALRQIGEPAAWRRLADAYPEDLRELEALSSLGEAEKAVLQALRPERNSFNAAPV